MKRKILFTLALLVGVPAVAFAGLVGYFMVFDSNLHYPFFSIGRSMEQYGLEDKEDLWIFPNQQCKEGNFCSFVCLAEKCKCPSEDRCPSFGKSESQLKKLISIKDDCYWFEGNPKPYEENSEWFESYDSRQYGCLKPNEFEMDGVITPVGQELN